MPNYDYHCPANGRTVEVFHGMGERLRTWGEVCARASIGGGSTPASAPVERALGTGIVRETASREARPRSGGCGPGCGCHPG
jgi:hypothetical protein